VSRPVALAVLLVSGCAGRTSPAPAVPEGTPTEGSAHLNQHLLGGGAARAALGRMVDPERWPLDGTMGEAHPCSRHLGVDAAEAAPPATGLWTAPDQTLYIEVEPKPGLVARIEDVRGLQQCCAENACPGAWFGEAASGVGKSWRPEADGWAKAGSVNGPFGLRLHGNPFVGEDCGLWRQFPPVTSDGRFFLGVSNTTWSPDNARLDARKKAEGAAKAWLRQESLGDRPMSDLVELRWCVESFPGVSGGDDHLATLLAWLPPA